MRKRTIALAAGAGTLSAALVAAMATTVPAATTGRATASQPVIHVRPGVKVLTQAKALSVPWTTSLCESALGIACFDPDQVRTAYNEAPLFSKGITGKGSTIVIVDSFGSPTIKNDLHVFDAQFGYPDPPSLKVITPAGPIPAFDPNNPDMNGWAGETTLDVEYAHTIAPGASIVLAETPDAETEGVTGFPNMIKSELAVLRHPERFGIKGKVTVISQSFGATEETFTSFKQLAPLRAAYIEAARKGVSVLASTGDDGATNATLDGSELYTTPVTGWPSTDPLVTAIGGTQLRQDATGKFSQVTWNDSFDVPLQQAFTGTDGPNPFATGGGVSEFFRLPFYQRGVARTVASAIGSPHARNLPRAVPDISMSGACDGAVTLYYSFDPSVVGWHLVCGTSEAAPLFSGIVALAAQVAHHNLGLVNPRLYALLARHAPGLVDVTSGDNTVGFTQGSPPQNFTVRGYSAGRGYDLATGVGTLNAALFVPELAGRG